MLTLSRSSLGALLVGLATLAALRWNVSRAIVATVAVVALGAAFIAVSPNTFGLNQGLNGASAGRAGLVSGGIDLFGQRPLWGYGSGAFVAQYGKHHPGTSTTLAASHTIAITIAAEQGLIGELEYIALVVAAAFTLLRGSRSDPARAAIAAAFVALVFHSELYADFLEDPVTWTLLGIGTALATGRRPGGESRSPSRGALTRPGVLPRLSSRRRRHARQLVGDPRRRQLSLRLVAERLGARLKRGQMNQQQLLDLGVDRHLHCLGGRGVDLGITRLRCRAPSLVREQLAARCEGARPGHRPCR